MKRFLAACLALVIATPAFAGGVYDYAVNGLVYAGTTDTVVFTRNVAGGAVTDGNAVRWRAEAQGVTGSTLRFVVNGVDVAKVDAVGSDNVFDVDLWRSGAGAAHVRVWECASPLTVCVPRDIAAVNGLAWNSQQTFQIIGKSGVGGMYLTRAGLAR